MNGVESIGSAEHAYHMPRVMSARGKSPTIEEADQRESAGLEGAPKPSEGSPAGERPPTVKGDGVKKSAGMEGALRLSEDFLLQTLTEVGYVNIHASNADKIETFLKFKLSQEEQAQVTLEPIVASALGAPMGSQMTGDINQVLRIFARVDPERVAALLK